MLTASLSLALDIPAKIYIKIGTLPYKENNCNTATSKPVKKDLLYLSKEERLKDGIAAIVDAFYHLKNRYSEGGG